MDVKHGETGWADARFAGSTTVTSSPRVEPWLSSVLLLDEFKIDTPRISDTKENIKLLLEANGDLLGSLESVMSCLKTKVS